MKENQAVAIVGMGAILPDATDVAQFWQNILQKKYSITDVPANRWRPELYFSTDPKDPDKTYSKIGAWVQGYQLEPFKLGLAIPPTVLAVMDQAQQWAIAATSQALKDYGYPNRPLDPNRVAVILGNAMAGENHYRSTMRILAPEYISALEGVAEFQNLPENVRTALVGGMQAKIRSQVPDITEDTMPGELGNIIAGRVANVYNFSGPNFVTDAACASSLAALEAACEGLLSYKFDAALSGGVDRNMGVESFVKFSKIGALSADGSRPYADGANGFVMGEGTAIFLLKRLSDAEAAGDKIYAVIRGIGGSSDGKGKGITAPNPLGQQRAIERAWKDAGVDPSTVMLIEGHGTSTKVGDVTEVNSLNAIFGQFGLPVGSVALGSVKSNIGHLKSAAGAAGMLKVALGLFNKTLPPSLNFNQPNPNIDFDHIPFKVNTEARPWDVKSGQVRRAGVSSFGFGGTNFHVVVEEYLPGMIQGEKFTIPVAAPQTVSLNPVAETMAAPMVVSQSIAVPSSVNMNEVKEFVLKVVAEKTGYPAEMLDLDLDLEADLGIDTVKQAELFATIRTNYGIPRKEDLRLSDYNTLSKVIGFVIDNAGQSAAVAEAPASAESEPAPVQTNVPVEAVAVASAGAFDQSAVQAYILQVVAEKTGYPSEMLDLDLDLEADLGIDTVKQAELFATIRTNYGIPRKEDLRLSDYNTLSKVMGFVRDNLGAVGTVASTPSPSPMAETKVVTAPVAAVPVASSNELKPYQGLFFVSADTVDGLKSALQNEIDALKNGKSFDSKLPSREQVAKAERLAIDYTDSTELLKRAEKALGALDNSASGAWAALQGQGIYRGSGTAGKVAFLFPGQGSQYVNMLRDLRDSEPVVAATFQEADEVMTPILGRTLTSYIYVDGDEESLAQAEKDLKNTAITQPAMLTANVALLRVMEKYGFKPDMVTGHSLGEYAALVAAGVLTFAEALQVVSARGREMAKVSMDDNGCMAAVSGPLAKVEELLKTVDGYVVIANINSPVQSVIGGNTIAVENAIATFTAAGIQAQKIPVSHAFHTRIVAPASEPLKGVIAKMNVQAPKLPVIANVTGELYPTTKDEIVDILGRQVASPVQFVKGMQTMYDAGARVFVETGPKRVLNALATDNMKDKTGVIILATNHPRKGGKASFNEALAGLFAAGVGGVGSAATTQAVSPTVSTEVMQPVSDGKVTLSGSVVVTGAGLGLPGKTHNVFAADNVNALLTGENRIEAIPDADRQGMVEKKVTRLVKSEAGAVMEEITDVAQTLKLAGQRGSFDLVSEFGVPSERVESYDISTQLAIAAGIEALRDAGIPLVMNYRRTSKGTFLPDRWKLPESMQDETGIVFCSAFPGLDRMADESARFAEHQALIRQLEEVRYFKDTFIQMVPSGQTQLANELERRELCLQEEIKKLDYQFDRRFIFRVLSMGHSQFAEYIGARGPNTAVNAACATTTHGVSIAEDWIRNGRCRRVIIIAGDDVTNPNLMHWIGTSMFASGAASTEGDVRMAAMPFDKRRNGMLMGMGAAALVVESLDSARERGIRPICEIISTQTANSAFHGTRLDVSHVSSVMGRLLKVAEERFGVARSEIAGQTVFVSHETYTPARGGSASAEIRSLRENFGEYADQVIIANTKGFTGHSMGVGIEDVLAVKALELGMVPPIAFINEGFEPDPELGNLNLSKGGKYPVRYALRLGAGFGSQIAMTLYRQVPGTGERIDQAVYAPWLSAVAGYDSAELEVVQHTLRIKNQGTPKLVPASSTWEYGEGPRSWVDAKASAPSAVSAAPAVASKPVIVAPVKVEVAPVVAVPEPVAVLSAGVEDIKAFVLSVVSEKTGYPAEMLDLELDLEADLGIDTVKQAELFATIRTNYGIPRKEDLRLSDYNTLNKVIGFVVDNSKPAETKEVVVEPMMEAVAEPEVETSLIRQIPVPAIRPRVEYCVPSNITLDASARVLVVSDDDKQTAAMKKALTKLGVQVAVSSNADAVKVSAEENSKSALTGVYFLSGTNLKGSVKNNTSEQVGSQINSVMMPFQEMIKQLPDLKFLVSATRMGGLHGFSNTGIHPLGGLVSGFTKAMARERENLFVKVVDFERKADCTVESEHLISETLSDPVVEEVSYEGGVRYSPILREWNDSTDTTDTTSLPTGNVYVISGGSAGIIAPVVTDLAKAAKSNFYLLGRSALPAASDPDLALLRDDRNALRTKYMKVLADKGEKATPAAAEQMIAVLERASATLNLMATTHKMGSKIAYVQCDVTQVESVKSALETVQKEAGKVDVLLHAAGVEKSRKLESKPAGEFEQIVNVKVLGFYHLFKTMESMSLLPKSVVLFTSVAGRFGNSGQSDYAAANDALSKIAASLPTEYPNIQCVSIDWGAWGEVGMASRGNIPQLMKMAGIDMMNPRQAAATVREVLCSKFNGEMVVAASLGVLEGKTRETGILTEKADNALREGNPIHAMLSHLTSFTLKEGIRLETRLDPTQHAFLKDHSLNGIPVLPGVMGIEGFAVAAKHIASVLAADSKQGFEVKDLEDIHFMAPFKFYRNQPRHILWKAYGIREPRGLVIYVTLESEMELKSRAPEHVLHFSGTVNLTQTKSVGKADQAHKPVWKNRPSVTPEDIYQVYFHGPSFQVLDGVQRSGKNVLGKLRASLLPLNKEGQQQANTPLLVELCFQTAGLWEAGNTGILALPQSIENLTIYKSEINGSDIFAEVRPVEVDGQISFDARVVDSKGNVYLELKNYRTSPLPYSMESKLLEPLKLLSDN